MDARRDVLTRLRALIDRSHSQDVTGQVQTRRNSLDTVGISGLPIAKRNASATVAGCSEMGSDFLSSRVRRLGKVPATCKVGTLARVRRALTSLPVTERMQGVQYTTGITAESISKTVREKV